MWRFVILLLACLTAPAARAETKRLLYVTDPSGISVYDIDKAYSLVRKIDVPDSGSYKGIACSVPLGLLFVSSNKQDDLIAVDLATDRVVWRKKLGKYADSMAIAPDGKTLFVPYRDEDWWGVVRAADGELLAKIPVGRGENYKVDPIGSIGPHNTWISRDGSKVYMEVLTLPYIFVADTSTNKLTGKIGPFTKGIRPFAVSDDGRYVYANVDGLLGFEIGDVKTGKMIERVEAKTPRERLDQIPNPPARKPHSTPSHGVNLRPDQKEVWVVDGVYGYVYAYDVTQRPAKLVASMPLFQDPAKTPHPGWVSFSIDGRHAYPDGGVVLDTHSKKPVAWIPTSEKLIEIDFENGKAVKAGHR